MNNKPGYTQDYAPPPGPPPSYYNQQPNPDPPNPHPWQTAVPDNSLLPPPPSFTHDRSPTNNATESEAEAGRTWCLHHPLFPPSNLPAASSAEQNVGGDYDYNLFEPVNRHGAPRQTAPFYGAVAQIGKGRWKGHTERDCGDTTMLFAPAMWRAAIHPASLPQQDTKTIYYEVKLLGNSASSSRRRHRFLPTRSSNNNNNNNNKINNEDQQEEIGLALGFAAPPYPPFRLPGWHRGSWAIHGDDGHRYISDPDGGVSCVGGFQAGETVGVGMRFSLPPPPNPYTGHKSRERGAVQVACFFTRDGRVEHEWDLEGEEVDAETGRRDLTGLLGERDLCAAVGVFGCTAFEICFDPRGWVWGGTGKRW